MRFSFGVRAADQGICLTDTEGSVSVQTGSGRELPVSEKQNLGSGSRILTMGNGRAHIGIGEMGELSLEAGGILELRSSGNRPEFLLQNGILFFELNGETDSVNIRTSTTVLTACDAKGWVRIVDRYHTLLCLEEGSLSCCVTDPVSGQVKSASLTDHTAAECVVYPEEKDGERCDILLRELEEQDKEETLETAKAAGTASDVKGLSDIGNTKNEEKTETPSASSGKTVLRDPVWGGETAFAEESPEKEQTISLAEESKPVRHIPGTVLPPSTPDTPLPGGTAAAEPPAAASDSGHSSGGGSKPAAAVPEPAGPTEPQGLLVGTKLDNYGTIRIEEDGKLGLDGDNAFWIANMAGSAGEGIIINKGEIKGEVQNYQTASFTMESGSVTKVENVSGHAGKIQISGGTVKERICVGGGSFEMAGGTAEKGVNVSGGEFKMIGGTVEAGVYASDGEFKMTGGTVKAPQGEDSSAVEISKWGEIIGGTILNENGGVAICLKNGVLALADRAVVKAKEPLKLVAVELVSSDEPTVINYVSGFKGPDFDDENSKYEYDKVFIKEIAQEEDFTTLYISQRADGGLVSLKDLTDCFEDSVETVNAGKGDTITLSGNIEEACYLPVKAKGGTESAPVVLNLNGKELTILPLGGEYTGVKGTFCICDQGSWEIKNGTMILEEKMLVEEQCKVLLSDMTLYSAQGAGWGNLTIQGGTCTITNGVEIGEIYNEGGICDVVNTTEITGKDLAIYNSGVCNIENASVEWINNSEASSCNIKNAILGSLCIERGCKLNIADKVEIGYLENYDTCTMIEGKKKGDIVIGEVANQGTLIISNATIEHAVWNDHKCSLTMNDVIINKMEGSDDEYGRYDCIVINNCGTCTIGASKPFETEIYGRIVNGEGINDEIEDEGILNISDSWIEGSICNGVNINSIGPASCAYSDPDNSGAEDISENLKCTLSNCTLTVSCDYYPGIISGNGACYINGGTIIGKRDYVPLIQLIPYNRNIILQIKQNEQNGEKAILSNKGLAPGIYLVPGFNGSADITICEAVMEGVDAPVIKGELRSSGKITLTIEDGATLTSENPYGTILFSEIEKMEERVWKEADSGKEPCLYLNLNGGSIVNESSETSSEEWDSNYAAINLGFFEYDFSNAVLVNGTGTEVKVKGDRAPCIYYRRGMSEDPYTWKLCSDIPGYHSEIGADGYTYLLNGPSAASFSLLPEETESTSPEQEQPAEAPDEAVSEQEDSEDEETKEASDSEEEDETKPDEEDALLPSDSEEDLEESEAAPSGTDEPQEDL